MNLPLSTGGSQRIDPKSGVRPVVAIRRDDRSVLLFGGGLVLAAALLFVALEARRQGLDESQSAERHSRISETPEVIPELILPPTPQEGRKLQSGTWPGPAPNSIDNVGVPNTRPSGTSGRSRVPASPDGYELPMPQMIQPAGSPAQTTEPASVPATRQLVAGESAGAASARIMAARLGNSAMTVVQGTLISAVLETALDSTSAGQVRALVSRDVHGFDGTKILIPRGSRLYGVYESGVAQAQTRAMIRWTRLLRPDGVTVALDSPATDSLGRAGVAAKVDNHFIERLGNTILGFAGNVGSSLVARNIASAPIVVAVPGEGRSQRQLMEQESGALSPTLKVRQGTRVSVLVQHDLDFSAVQEGH